MLFLSCVYHASASIHFRLLVNTWERADLLAVVFAVFCHFPKCVLVHIRIKGEVGPPVKYFTDRSNALLLLWIICVIYVLCLPCFCVCSLLHCGHLPGKD